MTKRIPGLLVLLLAGWIDTTTASILTFEHLVIDRLDLAGTQTEGDFSYLAVGPGWEVIDYPGWRPPIGNPPSALSTFGSGPIEQSPVAGDYVDIFLTAGGFFSFNSVDFRTALTGKYGNSDDVTLIGLIDGVPVDTLDLFDSSLQFLTVDSGFTKPINRLRVQIAISGHSDAMILDNFNMTPSIPIPATLSLFAIALAGLASTRHMRHGFRRERRRQN
ncbi:MAG: hypothetical protein R3E50_05785 [Halioglobus sp.]